VISSGREDVEIMTNEKLTKGKFITRTAIMLAIAIAFQNLRGFVGDGFSGTLIIGSLVNLCLLLAVYLAGGWSAVVVSVLTPVVAFMQGHLKFPLFIPVVALGNCLLACVFIWVKKANEYLAVALAALFKFAFLYFAIPFTFTTFIAPSVPPLLLVNFGIVQLITAIIGGVLAVWIAVSLRSRVKMS
jgi:hypothetical protein